MNYTSCLLMTQCVPFPEYAYAFRYNPPFGKEIVSILSLSNQVGGLKEIMIQTFPHLIFCAKCLCFFLQPQFHILDVGPLIACKQTTECQ